MGALLARLCCSIRVLVVVALGWLQIGCQDQDRSEKAWEAAEALWLRRDPAAYKAFLAVDPQTPSGQKALQRLQEAEVHYHGALELLRAGRKGVREELQIGAAIAPMDPALLLPLARASQKQGLRLPALGFYRKYLSQAPSLQVPEDTVAMVRREMALLEKDLGEELGGVLDAPIGGNSIEAAQGEMRWPLSLGALGGLGLVGILGGIVALRRKRRTLERRAIEAPELHPRITYLIGALRHELLKHRVGAALSALSALAAQGKGPLSSAQRSFFEQRLGPSMLAAWEGHIRGLCGALGLPVDLRKSDPLFALAHKELQKLSRLVLARPFEGRVALAGARLREFDQALARLVANLCRTRVDRSLLEHAVADVRAELGSERVDPGPEVCVAGPDPTEGACFVDVYRADLLLIVRNLLRNAWLATLTTEPPRRVCLDTEIAMLPTGEEIVRLRVRDSSPANLPVDLASKPLSDMDPASGLGLVRTALNLYQGGLVVEPEPGPSYRKSVIVWFFRSEGSLAAEESLS